MVCIGSSVIITNKKTHAPFDLVPKRFCSPFRPKGRNGENVSSKNKDSAWPLKSKSKARLLPFLERVGYYDADASGTEEFLNSSRKGRRQLSRLSAAMNEKTALLAERPIEQYQSLANNNGPAIAQMSSTPPPGHRATSNLACSSDEIHVPVEEIPVKEEPGKVGFRC